MARSILTRFALLLLMFAAHGVACAQAEAMNVVFINGIQKTAEEARVSGNRLRSELITTATRAPDNRRSFLVSVVYNPTGWENQDYSDNTTLGFVRDNLELFLLKTAEECFRTDFRSIVVPHNQSRPLDREAATRVSAYLNSIIPGSRGGHSCGDTGLVVSADNMEPTKQAAIGLIQHVKSVGRAIVVAHSEGNLLAHLAYASLATEYGNDANRMIRIVNVANTSQLSAHGLDMTHSSDRAISWALPLLPDALNALGAKTGQRLGSRATPDCLLSDLCRFAVSSPSLGSASGYGDLDHHGFIETYLSDYTVDIADTQGVAFTLGAQRFVDRFVDFVYAAASSLDTVNALPPIVTLTAATCTTPIVGVPMTCAVLGSNLPMTVSFSASNCGPSPMASVLGGNGMQQQFTCTPVAAGIPVAVSYSVPGFVGPLPVVPTVSAVSERAASSQGQRIAPGYAHTCAVTTTDGVKCWGDNLSGQLGDGTNASRLTPVDVVGLSAGIAAVSAGMDQSCALTRAGGVKCWGLNGRLGNGTSGPVLTPVDVVGLASGVKAIAGGAQHTCAVTTSGGVKCWGQNFGGQLGDGTTQSSLVPVDVVGLSSGVSAISAGYSHTCAITNGGGVKCWGADNGGTLGDGTAQNRLTPVDVVGLNSGVVAIATGMSNSCAVTSGGATLCWGRGGYYSAIGDGTTESRSTPVGVFGLSSGVAAIATGDRYQCALMSAGGVKCWGYSSAGGLGNGTVDPQWTPVDVVGLSSAATSISAQTDRTCVLMSTGGAMCWGWNISGALGDGTYVNRLTPVSVVGY